MEPSRYPYNWAPGTTHNRGDLCFPEKEIILGKLLRDGELNMAKELDVVVMWFRL
jgi:hypothetical protein